MNHSKHALIAQATATHCCVCTRQLTDAESVEHGIGPTCSGKYYNPLHKPTRDMVMEALGLLAFSGLPPHIVDGVLKVVNNDHNNAREGCNVLVYWASVNFGQREEVFKCTRVIRALGYVELADKLETDRAVASIKTETKHLVVYVPGNSRFRRDMELIPGIESIRDEEGRQAKMKSKVGWHVPLKQREHLMAILGVNYGKELMIVDSQLTVIPSKRLADLLAVRNGDKATAKSHGGIQFTEKGSVIEVCTPYDDRFRRVVAALPRKDRRWNGRCWEVHPKYKAMLIKVIGDVFGVVLS